MAIGTGLLGTGNSLAGRIIPASAGASLSPAPPAPPNASFSPTVPACYAETIDGVLFVATGMEPMVKWNALKNRADTVGVLPPTQAIALSGVNSGALTGTYTVYLRFIDADGHPSNLSPISNQVTVAGVQQLTIANVQVPTEAKVVRRQILRNTDGQATTYYVDIDTYDLTSTVFPSTRTDTDLSSQLAVPLFAPSGEVLANAHTVPPNWKRAIAYHLGRMFAVGEVDWTHGNVQVTNGSVVVLGIGAGFKAALVNRFLWVVGASQPYQIGSVDEVGQALALLTPYADATNLFAEYGIRPPPAERRLLYYSEPGDPEGWPATNAVTIQADGDDITALMAKGSFLYILERRHIYRFTFQADPATDGFVFLGSQRGCINHRCYVVVEDVAYMLDEAGVHGFSGGQESEPVSNPIQQIFRQDATDLRINWRARDYFHACLYREQETIRWFVALNGEYLPRHALAYDYRAKRWWMEEYPVAVGASAEGLLNGVPRTYFGSDGARVLAYWYGTLDGVDATAGTVRGSVTASTPTSFTDSTASFAASGLVGNPVSIVAGRGKGQQRRVVQVGGGKVTVAQPWLIQPDTTSTYQLGGIQWRYRSGYFRFAASEQNTVRRLEIVFEPAMAAATMDLRVFLDADITPVVWTESWSLDDGRGIASTINASDLVVDLTKTDGFVQQRLEGHKELYLDGPRWIAIELAGVTNQDMLTVYQVTIDGAVA